MKCPRDGADLTEQRYEADVMVDACRGCGGVWLDDGELRTIQQTIERDYKKDLEQSPNFVGSAAEMARQRSAEPATCPKCGVEMVAAEYHGSLVVIDTCPAGCGIWLDKGELAAIEVYFERARKETATEDDILWRMRSFWVSLRGKSPPKR